MVILEEVLEGPVLTVLVEVPLRRTVAEKVKFISSEDIIGKLQEKYQVTSIVKNNRLSNSMRGAGKQKGTWIFMIKEQVKKRPTKRKPTVSKSKDDNSNTLSQKSELPQEETKVSTKRSIRGRMSKIAKEKNRQQKDI